MRENDDDGFDVLDFDEDDMDDYVCCIDCDFEMLLDEAGGCDRCGLPICKECTVEGDDIDPHLCKACAKKMKGGK